MPFHLFPNFKAAAQKLLSVKMQLYDGTEFTGKVEDAELVFETALNKKSKVALSSIRRMKNLGHAVIMRELLQVNKFEIHFVDGCKLFGVPKSSTKIHLNGVNPSHERGHIALWEINFLEVLSETCSQVLAA